ncbi:MAG: sterol desaturase family protein [Rickettsiales bacterium]
MDDIINFIADKLWILTGAFILFTALSIIFPCNKSQKILRGGIITDILYSTVLPIMTKYVFVIFLLSGFGIIFHDVPQEEIHNYLANGYGYFSTLPLYIQATIVFITSDFLLYWGHRIFHSPELWKWHAIHHSPKEVDWLSAYRFHPINVWSTFTLVNVFMLLIGFSPASIAVMGGFNMMYSFMVHANLNWTFGPFRYVFASPVFHRWHHTTQKEGLDKNFAPTFPLLDIMFGTFYMPEGKLPEKYGVLGSDIPESFIGQIIWPFKQHNNKHKKPPVTNNKDNNATV